MIREKSSSMRLRKDARKETMRKQRGVAINEKKTLRSHGTMNENPIMGT